MEDLYTNKIDEFVDWVSGENSFTGDNVTGGRKVAGSQIRELLQEKLKKPIHVVEDIPNNVYRIFSSESAYNLWAENPSDNAELQLFTIPRPSDYKLDLTLSNAGDRYVKYGDTTSPLTRIQFFWRIYNDEGNASDGLTVTYTISNVDGSSNTFTRRYNNGVAEDFSIANYLKVGENQITIEARGNNTGARNATSFNITVLDIQVSCDFNFAGNHSKNEALRVPYTFYRNNVDGTAKLYFVVDDGQNGNTFSVDILRGGQTRIEDTGMMISPSLEEGQHSLQIYAEATYNEGQITVYSNLLYFTFVIASNEPGVTDKFINIATSFNNGNYPFSSLTLTTTQYYNTSLRWGYYTYAANTDTQIPVIWKMLEGADDENPIVLGKSNAKTAYEASELNYIPTLYTDDKQLFVAAYFGESELVRIPIYITQNDDLKNLYETPNYELKMSAYGRTNDSSDKNVWLDSTGNINTTFTNIDWNPNSGWYENSFRTIGQNQYATINFKPLLHKDGDFTFPFTYGKTVEIEFESEKVSNANDKLIVIGDPSGCRIEITPNTAALYNNDNNEVIHTNYKANERIKLAFIINKISQGSSATVDDGLAYIVNNGILERGNLVSGYSFDGDGYIKIGGSNSGVRVYNLRVYDKSITYTDAYNNYVYDSENKAEIVQKNNILDQGVISYDLCKNKLDTILITGNLSELLRQGPNKTDADVMIERTCPYDQSKDFILGDLIDDPDRPDEKIVVNGVRIRKHGQSTLNYPITSMKFWTNKAKSGIAPIFSKTGQEGLLLNKNRYKMKNSSIPANKFVLQANYADSSGAHNGGLLRLIQDSWYNARIDGQYKLRTLPQLFTTLKSNEKAAYGLDHVWADYFPKNAFPYNIQNAPDSFPCAVFYYDLEGTKTSTFLGQYVFMEDKKSDYCYGERSIYKVATDPFCLTVTHANDDTKENCIWDNKNVLRIEVLNVNDKYASYTTDEGFDTFSGGKYGWENSFEMIYPDPDDVDEDDAKDGLSKSNPNSKFYKKSKPFVDWYKWVISTRNNHEKFRAEAADHLDLYKLAAYYIFVLRFALVDSLERNAQIKTYDGVHFHYEPWDMDIALGNKNDGGIAYNPPVDRNTKLNTTTYAISGKAADSNGNVIISNWLWDALEAWPEWMNEIVPKVADALYNAGLTYDNVTAMFDDEYVNKWCEIMYNKSGHFKYVQSSGGDSRWLGWLQGARMSHRHWWLSTSMDYYDAKWFCGDYKNHAVYLAANITADPNKKIVVTPNNSTYMTVTVNDQEEGNGEQVDVTRSVTPQSPLEYYMTNGASTKAPIHIYGANFMESIDMSDIATGIDALDLTSTYSQVLGAPLKSLNIGTPIVEQSEDVYTTILSPSTCGVSPTQTGINAFENLETLNIRGHMHLGNVQQFSFGINQWTRDLNMSQLKNFYAMGSNLTNFYSSDSGNNFETIELPSTVSVLNIKNSTWQNITFWDTTVGQNDSATLTKHSTVITGGGTVNIPSTLMEVHFLGSSGRTRESLLFVRDWLKSIVETEGEEELYKYTLEMDDVFWSPDVIGNDEDLLTYDELALIYKMNGNVGSNGKKTIPIRGYIVLKYEGAGTELTSQQLTEIRTWFGDTVFTKGSSGLVVDYKHNYIQINVGGDVIIENGEIYMREGSRAMLSATQFLLAETQGDNYIWGLSQPGQSQTFSQIGGVSILSAENTSDGNTYLVSSESLNGQDYDIVVKVTAGGQIYSSTIHIIAAKYPTSLQLDCTKYGTIEPRKNVNTIVLWTNGIACNVFVTEGSTYSANIRSIVYTITAPSGRTGTYSTSTGPSWEGESFNIDDRLNIQAVNNSIGMGGTSCIRVSCPDGIPNGSETYEYTLQVVVTFKSDKQMTINGRIVLMNDTIAIVSRLQEFLYKAISDRWEAQTGEELTKNNLYRSDLISLDGTLTFGPDSQFNNIVTNKGTDSVLKYLPSVTGLVFDNNTNLTSTYNTITEDNGNQFIFTNMPQLKKLYIQNCTSLTEDIDLTMCADLEEVDASGTSINVFIPADSKVTKYELGLPTSVSIVRPTVLTPSGVWLAGYKNLTSLQIVKGSSQTCNAFQLFDKITQNYFGAMYIGYSSGWHQSIDLFEKSGGFTTQPIDVRNHQKIQIFSDFYRDKNGTIENGKTYTSWFRADRSYRWDAVASNEQIYDFTADWLNGEIAYIIISNAVNYNEFHMGTYLRVEDYTTHEVIYEWRA